MCAMLYVLDMLQCCLHIQLTNHLLSVADGLEKRPGGEVDTTELDHEAGVVLANADHPVGEAMVEGNNRLEVLDVFLGQGDVESVKVGLEVLDLPATDDGEDEGSLVHDVCNSD
jgi:hypothetical protein